MKKVLTLLAVAFGLILGPFPDAAVAGAKDDTRTTHNSAGKKTPKQAASKKASGKNPLLRSASVLVTDLSSGKVLYEKNADAVLPIASITKLMTAMVVLDAKQGLNDMLTVTTDDIDTIKKSYSRLSIGTKLSRNNMLRLALMASENRAASALSRHYPGGRKAFVRAMNNKARWLGLKETRFTEATGLSSANVSSAHDLARLVAAAHKYPLIRKFTTTHEYTVAVQHQKQTFRNTNKLVRNSNWDISLSKTGYIKEAGRCLVMQAKLAHRHTIIVLLDSQGSLTRIGDANRIRSWIEHATMKQRDSAG